MVYLEYLPCSNSKIPNWNLEHSSFVSWKQKLSGKRFILHRQINNNAEI
jgi:hypothetical protein